MSAAIVFLKVVLSAALIVGGAVLAVWFLVKGTQGLLWALGGCARGVGFLVSHTVAFVRNTIRDTFRTLGAALTALVLLPLCVLNLLFLRWKSAGHYGRALEDELVRLGQGAYRVAIGNPLHFVGLGLLTEGIESRLPEVLARTPDGVAARAAAGRFEGYEVEDELPAGGSGARLYLARPSRERLARFAASGHSDPGRVVIKAFSLQTGSTLPQIVRESRALEAARQLGLVLDHELTEASFHYVMPYVPGEQLDTVASRLHRSAPPAGLTDRQLRTALGYVGDVLYSLEAFHRGGLWHKDIKPSNVIVSEGRAHLVDLGLVTPLASAMTLTTHGTEYFRDPEMVRQALRGVKVHEVNGVKFDVYSTGALLFAMLENSFPGQGSLSRLTKRCPDVVQWIVRRAMADLDQRYGDAREMLVDIRTVLAAQDPYALRPADLPSVSGKAAPDFPPADLRRASSAAAAAATAPRAARPTPRPTPRPAARRAGRTSTGEREVRRSVGRSIAAALVGILFLVGVAGAAGLMFFGRSSTTHSHGPKPDVHAGRVELQEALARAMEASGEEDPEGWARALAGLQEVTDDEELLGLLEQEDGKLPEDLAEILRGGPTADELQQAVQESMEESLKKVREPLLQIHIESAKQDQHETNTASWSELSYELGDGRTASADALSRVWLGALGHPLDQLAKTREGAPRILVANDAAPLPEGVLSSIETAVREAGATTLAELPDESVRLEAELRRAAGLVTAEDPEAARRLMAFARESEDIDAILWLARTPGRGSAGRLHFVLAAPTESPAGRTAASAQR